MDKQSQPHSFVYPLLLIHTNLKKAAMLHQLIKLMLLSETKYY